MGIAAGIKAYSRGMTLLLEGGLNVESCKFFPEGERSG